jgi:AcrR family transcriptional regulator
MVAAKTRKTIRKKAAAKRRERHAELARKDILEAAAASFAELGYREATVQDIAARAGFTAASLYTYFSGKADIFNALVDLVLNDVDGAFARPAAPGVDFSGRLDGLTRDLFEVAERHHHAVIYFLQLQEQGGYRPGGAHRRVPNALANVEAWFERNAGARDLRQVSTREAAVHYWSLSGGVVRVWAHEEGAGSLVAQAPRLVDFFLHGVRGKPRAKR